MNLGFLWALSFHLLCNLRNSLDHLAPSNIQRTIALQALCKLIYVIGEWNVLSLLTVVYFRTLFALYTIGELPLVFIQFNSFSNWITAGYIPNWIVFGSKPKMKQNKWRKTNLWILRNWCNCLAFLQYWLEYAHTNTEPIFCMGFNIVGRKKNTLSAAQFPLHMEMLSFAFSRISHFTVCFVWCSVRISPSCLVALHFYMVPLSLFNKIN